MLSLTAPAPQKQAMSMRYNDAFLLIGLSVVLVSPLIFLLRMSRPKVPAAAAEMH